MRKRLKFGMRTFSGRGRGGEVGGRFGEDWVTGQA